MSQDYIFIKGAREHNLKNIDVKIPRNCLTVITGLSGSGKSSLAFDTIYAEGQRRYVESLSSYARQFLEQLQKPDVDYIEGLSPSVSIEQRTAGSNPRSTVGTTTEIYDYLRLLFAKIGIPHCYKCGRPIREQTSSQIVERILGLPEGTAIVVLAPLVRGRKGEYSQIFKELTKEGFIRVRVDGEIRRLEEKITLDKKKKHTIEVVIDRLFVGTKIKNRLTDSIETALKAGGGIVLVSLEKEDLLFSQVHACVECGISFGKLEPRMFSFNSPYGACPACSGLGTKLEIDPDLIISDKTKTIREGAIESWRKGGRGVIMYYNALLREVAGEYGFSLDTPFNKLSRQLQKTILYGGEEWIWGKPWEGVIPNLERRFKETKSDFVRDEIHKFMSTSPCPECKGERLRPEALAVAVAGKSIMGITRLSVAGAKRFFLKIRLDGKQELIARQILKQLNERLEFMTNVGLDYLTLDRVSSTLSGGEAQRIRLATQIGSRLMGVLYVLDEPSIGLHQRDNRKLLESLEALRVLGNTLIVVEHDEQTIRAAGYIIDLGPGAGKHGGKVVAGGSLKKVLKESRSLTAKYLNRELQIPVPEQRRSYRGKSSIAIKGATEHNLKNIDVSIPLGLFVCVTGVSGSGKSTLIDEILYRGLARKIYKSRRRPGAHRRITGASLIDKLVVIDQSPIGRTPRSNPATYTNVFTYIREIFSLLPEARLRGYKPGRFSFNVKGGRCEACQGEGIIRVEMHFLPDVYVPCQVCKGRRYNPQTLEVKYKGNSIADVLELKVEDALALFRNIPRIKDKLDTLYRVGLGYIELGQFATTLSGGEAQRVKLSTYLSKRATGRTFYILDEPTTGLHFADVDRLLKVLQALVAAGNTVLVIEHNLDVVKCADYIIDLGPEGGEDGGRVVARGSPEEVARVKDSYTGQYLKKVL